MIELPKATQLGELTLQKTLEYFDFPRIFTCKNNSGQTFLVLSTYDDEWAYHWLYLPLSLLRLQAVLDGQLSLHYAFRNPEDGYLFRVNTFVSKPCEVAYILPEQVPGDDLPSPEYRLSLSNDEDGSDEEVKNAQVVATATRRETFNYHIFPNDPRAHEIASRKLGGILTSTQELLDALGQTKEVEEPTVRGPLPAELLQQTRVNVSHVFKGSFGVQFRAAQNSDLLNDSKVSGAISEFGSLLSAGDSEDLLSNKLHALKGRVASKYRRLLKELTDINSGLILDWGSVKREQSGKFSLTRQQVKNAYAIVDRIDIAMAEELLVDGQLVGFNSRTQRYEIRSTDDNKNYSGKVDSGANINVIKPAIGEFYTARLRMLVETQSTSGDELIRWVLVGLEYRNRQGSA